MGCGSSTTGGDPPPPQPVVQGEPVVQGQPVGQGYVPGAPYGGGALYGGGAPYGGGGGAAQAPGKGPPVQAHYANGFLNALRAEYLRGEDGGVGNFYNAEEVPGEVQGALDPYEERVRNAGDKEWAINAIAAEWQGPAPAAAPVAAAPAAAAGSLAPIAAGTSVQDSLAAILRGLGLPPNTPPQTLALQGLGSEDLEIVRHALHVSPHYGLLGREEVRNADRRLRGAKQLPMDWNMTVYAAGRFLEGGLGGRVDSTVIAFELQNAGVMQEIQGMFDATYRKVYTRDRRGAPIPDRFAIREVYRVMNDQVWREYVKRREEVRGRLQGARPAVPEGAQTMNYLRKRKSSQARGGSSSLPELDNEVNETWLFHGTTREAAQGIAENDFRLDLTGSNAGTLYGKGIYLAENATKSDEYGEGPKGPAGEQAERGYEAPRPPPGPPPSLVRESYILLCRSTLGKVNYTDELRPDADALQSSCLSGEFDSVLGDRLKRNGTFRELIVYNDDHVYPEFVIRYERIFFHERFAEIYSAMCRRKKQGNFRGPTPDEKEILTSMWNVYGMPNRGKINKWQLLDLLTAIQQPPMNEEDDLDATFTEWDTKKDGWIDCDEFLQEMTQRVNDGIEYYQ